MSQDNSFIVTIRSTGERTEKACIHSLMDEGVKKSQIHVIKEAPFKKSLETCFSTGIESKAKWLLTFDADMILIPDVLNGFFEMAENMPEENLQIQGKILDKFFVSVRRGGPRLYRVCYLTKALEISRSLEDHIRPETNVISKMGKLGYPSRYISTTIALHDFEQYYSDIYRKSYAHAIKHIDKLPKIIKRITEIEESDLDYKVFLKGIFDSVINNKEISIDKRILKVETEKAFKEMCIAEKKDSIDSVDVNEILVHYSVTESQLSFKDTFVKDVPTTKSSLLSKRIQEHGLITSSLIFIGVFFEKISKYIKKSTNTN